MPFEEGGDRHAVLILKLLLPLCVACLVVAGSGPVLSAHALSQSSSSPALPRASLLPTPLGSSSQPAYDEQIGETFTQSFTSIEYDVIAVEQQDPSTGYGPAYLLNGLSNQGYWYQVGLSWNWCGPISGVCSGYTAGFNMNFEVFDSGGHSIYPTNGGGGLARYSGPVNQGDTVVLNLYFSNGEVFMLSQDLNTSAEATVAYSAEGATSFVGLSEPDNSNGFFTGLMTEWYHASPFYGNEQEVRYTDNNFALTSAWMWMDEFNSQNRSQVLFVEGSGLLFYSNPSQLQELSSNGATEYSDAYEFITGAVSQDLLTVSYSVRGGGTGYFPPTLYYVSGGMQEVVSLNSSYTTYTLDPGSSWSITSTLLGSTYSERWQTNQTVSGVATSSQTTTFVYYHQYLVNASFSVANGGSGYSPPMFQFTQFGEQAFFSETPTYGAELWVDAGSSYSFTNPLPGSNSTQRWQNLLGASGTTVLGSGPLSPVYYYQLDQVLSYTVSDGGSPSAPSATGSLFGSAYSTQLTMTPTGYWFDANSPYPTGLISFNSTISGAFNERWVTPLANISSTSPATTKLVYFHQFITLFDFSVVNGAAPKVQDMTCEQEGSPASLPLATTPLSYWCDSGTTVNAANPASGSTATERWSDNGQSFTISVGSGVDTFTYYRQFLVTLSYSLIDGGLPSPPSFNGTSFGMQTSGQLSSSPTAFWLDNGSALNVPATLNFPASLLPPSNSERWVANETFPLTVDAAVSETVGYQHQYYVNLVSAKTGGGTVSPSSQWYNATSTLQLTASPSAGWSLGRWDGSGPASYSGNATTTSVQVEGAINETAVFYPGLTLIVGADGSVAYSYAAVRGVETQIAFLGPALPPGQHTIFVPPGTNVTLTEKPSSFLYSFAGWTISKTSGSSTVGLVVNAPESEEATFSYNLVVIGAIVGGVVVIVAAVVVFSRKRGAHKLPNTTATA